MKIDKISLLNGGDNMDYEKMWKELKEKLENLSPHYGELTNKGVINFMDNIEKENR
jgi:hypothetical protein